MKTGRHVAGISREAEVSEQNLQHFMTCSPWSGAAVCRTVQEDLKGTVGLAHGGVLVVDESADEKAGEGSVGAGRQYNGRLGKVEMSQVAVLLSYVNLTVPPGLWSWIEGEWFLPKAGFEADQAARRQRLGLPKDLTFATKVELAWKLIQRAQDQGIPFEMVAMDCLYGRSGWLRGQMRPAGIGYMAEVPADTHVYLTRPELGIPPRRSNRGRAPARVKVRAGEAVTVASLGQQAAGQEIRVRATARGELRDRFAACRVWTVPAGQATEEWLVLRREANGHTTYALSNAAVTTDLTSLAWWKCQRYFIERSNQDAKSEFGWDALQAQKYRAWEHHLALTVLASWFVAQTKSEWAQSYPRDPELLAHWKTEVLPALSVANFRELLRAVMPLKRLNAWCESTV
jgi:SRSO17 transposase